MDLVGASGEWLDDDSQQWSKDASRPCEDEIELVVLALLAAA
jgi:hypothetical protein